MIPASKSDFIGLEGFAHLASGGQPPLLKAHQEAFEAFARDKSMGMGGYDNHWAVVQRVREQLAAMVKLKVEDIALQGNTSEGIAKVISSIDWQEGDNVVTPALDYASGRFTLSNLARRGVELRLPQAKDWFIDLDDVIAACDERTRLVYLSHVNAHTGQKIDLDRISGGLKDRGIPLLLDASHSLGVLPVDARKCDFLVSCTYKFLMSPHMGVFAWNKERHPDFEPLGVGRFSAFDTEDPGSYKLRPDARRVELGNVSHISAYLMEKSLSYICRHPETVVERHVMDLSTRLREGVERLGLPLLTPKDERDRGPNVSIGVGAPRAMVDLAGKENIILWGEANRLRASMHLFVTQDDVDRFLDWLPEGIRQTADQHETPLWE